MTAIFLEKLIPGPSCASLEVTGLGIKIKSVNAQFEVEVSRPLPTKAFHIICRGLQAVIDVPGQHRQAFAVISYQVQQYRRVEAAAKSYQ